MNYDAKKCNICPRGCNADRTKGLGFCGVSHKIKIARAAPHFWEEPCVSGENGSGTVFFSGCNLRCVFCQNSKISTGSMGSEVTPEQLSHMYFSLKEQGVHNINLVTPSHYAFAVAKSIETAKAEGFDLPFVYNCGGYESTDALKALDGLVDIYLPDFKYADSVLAEKYSRASDYLPVCLSALKEMKRQQPADVFENGIMKKGVIIRHLVLPGCTENSLDVLDLIKKHFSTKQIISLMSQYTPMESCKADELNRTVTPEEYERVTGYAMLIGLKNGYFQEGESVGESFIPEFSDNI